MGATGSNRIFGTGDFKRAPEYPGDGISWLLSYLKKWNNRNDSFLTFGSNLRNKISMWSVFQMLSNHAKIKSWSQIFINVLHKLIKRIKVN